MRILADENFPGPLVDLLRLNGHDVSWVRTYYRGWKDPKLLDLAEGESRIVFTLDKDFYQIAHQRKEPLHWSGVILFRVHPATVPALRPLVLSVVESSTEWRGHISVVTVDKIKRRSWEPK